MSACIFTATLNFIENLSDDELDKYINIWSEDFTGKTENALFRDMNSAYRLNLYRAKMEKTIRSRIKKIKDIDKNKEYLKIKMMIAWHTIPYTPELMLAYLDYLQFGRGTLIIDSQGLTRKKTFLQKILWWK